MSQQTPSEYLHNKNMRTNTLFRIEGTQSYYILKGYKFKKEEFESMFPIAEAIRQPGEFHHQDIVRFRP
jgi:hypothetical protein